MSDLLDPVSIPTALAQIDGRWEPHRLVSVNDQDVKMAKIEGEFIWHTHPESDELFLVVSGELTLQLRETTGQREVTLGPQDVFVVPRGIEHCPKTPAGVETVIIMIEKRGTVNTGDAGGDRTVEVQELS
jgi:mannose-6-phosphate isomerase-like protein (cupin superfamily)